MYTFEVEKMSCQKCVARINEAVSGIDPHAEVDVDLSEGKVFIESRAAAADLRESIDKAGYPAKIVE